MIQKYKLTKYLLVFFSLINLSCTNQAYDSLSINNPLSVDANKMTDSTNINNDFKYGKLIIKILFDESFIYNFKKNVESINFKVKNTNLLSKVELKIISQSENLLKNFSIILPEQPSNEQIYKLYQGKYKLYVEAFGINGNIAFSGYSDFYINENKASELEVYFQYKNNISQEVKNEL